MQIKIIILIGLLLAGCTNDCDTDVSQKETNNVQAMTEVPEPFVTPINQAVKDKPQVNKKTYQLARGSTITHVLKGAGFTVAEIYRLADALKNVYDVNKVQSGTQFDVVISDVEKTLIFASEYGALIEATLSENEWHIGKQSIAMLENRFSETFEINHSLYKAAKKANIPANVVNSVVLAMSHFVDFQREIRQGDRITLYFSQSTVTADAHLFSKFAEPQQLIALEFENQQKHYHLYQYDNAFYFKDGKLAQNFLMKTPLNGARLSSYFGKRKHPVLGYTRQHKGIDFSAPVGTPIMAAGKGKIVKANYSRSFGNRILIDHGNGYRTLYAHLKGFAKGVKKGAPVSQGQIIGYLGNTGLSTARHLHYEVHKNGKAINPLNMKQPSNVQLTGQELVAFHAHIQDVEQIYARLNNQQALLAE